MRIINPSWSAARQSTDPLRSRAKQRRFLKSRKDGADYLKGVHKYEMEHNSKLQNEFRVMTGLEAKSINEILRKRFITAVQMAYPARVAVPLEHWRCVERFTTEKPTDDPIWQE